MQLSLLFHFCLLLIGNEAKQFYKCAVARILKAEGMDGYGGHSLGDWLCVINYTSDFDSHFKENYFTSKKRFGMFQIDNNEFCNEYCSDSENKCSVHCSKLVDDDIRDDIACAKIIVNSPHKIEYWRVWKDYCSNKNNSKWLKKCKL
ncbi:lysozyme C, milk isozyme-like [Anolis sagrei]|uniref:lysozyme C, milk isozyme-like n=1 Tax=Anolis sagrei TaxID=38937 RepID=UPI003520DD59